MTMFYPNPCFNNMRYRGSALNVPKSPIITPGRWQSKTSIISANVDKKSLEREFSIAIAICRQLPNGNRKHCFYRFFIRVHGLSRVFSIAAYLMAVYLFQVSNDEDEEDDVEEYYVKYKNL